jgi:hypothetical protein
MDHGYRYGWGWNTDKFRLTDIPEGVQRLRTWVSFYPATYLKKWRYRDPTDGQLTMLQINQGMLFVELIRVVDQCHRKTRADIHLKDENGEGVERQLIHMRQGDIM